jgi:hypothetical protein
VRSRPGRLRQDHRDERSRTAPQMIASGAREHPFPQG